MIVQSLTPSCGQWEKNLTWPRAGAAQDRLFSHCPATDDAGNVMGGITPGTLVKSHVGSKSTSPLWCGTEKARALASDVYRAPRQRSTWTVARGSSSTQPFEGPFEPWAPLSSGNSLHQRCCVPVTLCFPHRCNTTLLIILPLLNQDVSAKLWAALKALRLSPVLLNSLWPNTGREVWVGLQNIIIQDF